MIKFVGRNFCGIHHDITEKFWAETMLKNHFGSSFVGKIKFFWHFERVAQFENTSLDFSKSLRFMFKNIIIENKCYMNDCKQKCTLIILIDSANFVRLILKMTVQIIFEGAFYDTCLSVILLIFTTTSILLIVMRWRFQNIAVVRAYMTMHFLLQ